MVAPISLIRTVNNTMSPDEFIKLQTALKEAVADQVKVTVNGKIEKLIASQEELKTWFIEHAQEDRMNAKIMSDYIITDNEWKEKAKPIIELGENISWSSSALLKVLGAIGTIAAIVAVVFNISRK